MSYKITHTNLSNDKMFILQKNEFEKRYDPSWYVYLKTIQDFKYKKIALKKLLLSNPQYGANEIGIERITNIQPRYIRITDINEFGELENELGKTASLIEDKFILETNDLLLARSGNTVGKSYLHKNVNYDCFFAGYMIRFKINESLVLPQYVFIYTQTDFYKKWIKAIQRSTGQPNINAEEYRNLEIPLPSFAIQEKIIEIYFSFLKQKQQNELEAEKLLTSIDTYLLNQLGITLPTQEENTLKSRMFTTPLKELSSSRFDPFFHTEYFKQIELNLSNTKYDLLKLKSISNFQNGFAFKSSDYSMVKTNTLNIRMSNIRPNNNFDPDYNVKYLPDNYSEIYKEYLLNDGDIVIAMTDMAADPKILGVPTIITNANSRNLLLNQRVGKLYNFDLSKIDITYLKEILSSKIIKSYYNKMGARGVQINISSEQILSALVPIPPLEKQIEIANHITGIRKQAQSLKDKTKLALQKANEEIENLLLN
jgi:type I restriction enzyme S subunit